MGWDTFLDENFTLKNVISYKLFEFFNFFWFNNDNIGKCLNRKCLPPWRSIKQASPVPLTQLRSHHCLALGSPAYPETHLWARSGCGQNPGRGFMTEVPIAGWQSGVPPSSQKSLSGPSHTSFFTPAACTFPLSAMSLASLPHQPEETRRLEALCDGVRATRMMFFKTICSIKRNLVWE